jgi:hypothetical protein
VPGENTIQALIESINQVSPFLWQLGKLPLGGKIYNGYQLIFYRSHKVTCTKILWR